MIGFLKELQLNDNKTSFSADENNNLFFLELLKKQLVEFKASN